MIVHMFIRSNGKGEAGRGVSTRGREKWQKGPDHLQQDRSRQARHSVQTGRPKSGPGEAERACRGRARHAVTSSDIMHKTQSQQAMKAQHIPRGQDESTTYCTKSADRPAAATPRAAGWTAAGVKEARQRRPGPARRGVFGRLRAMAGYPH